MKSIFWSSVWKDAGHPSDGELFNIMKFKKKCYKDAINYIKKNRKNIIKENVYMTLCRNDTNFWKEVNKFKLRYNVKTNILDGVVGDNNICNVFQEKYQKLYNEFSNDNNY